LLRRKIMNHKVLMEEMSWVEIHEAIRKGKTTVIVVSGSIEQHGPHLPTGTDTFLGYEIAARAAVKLGNALVAPVIRPALSEHHLGFPGSLTLRWKTYFAVLEDICSSLARYGFKDLVLTSSHGGNTAVLTALTPDLARDLHGKIRVHVVDYLQRGSAKQRPLFDKMGISRAKAGVHAGFGETSEMLAMRPGLVRMDRAKRGLDRESFYDPANIARSQIDSFILGIKHFSPNGILGDPRGATAQIGKKLSDIMVESLAQAISEAVGKKKRKTTGRKK
jgi:creatinine amidohydrolase